MTFFFSFLATCGFWRIFHWAVLLCCWLNGCIKTDGKVCQSRSHLEIRGNVWRIATSQWIALRGRNGSWQRFPPRESLFAPALWPPECPLITLNIYMTFDTKPASREAVCSVGWYRLCPELCGDTVTHNCTAGQALLWLRTLGCLPSAPWHQCILYTHCVMKCHRGCSYCSFEDSTHPWVCTPISGYDLSHLNTSMCC